MMPAENMPRRGDFMQTFTGRKFWPLDARPEDVAIDDIAHALSMQCRYAGHCVRFYSVAEHSVHVARWLASQGYGVEIQMAGLLHDATEAYMVDLPRPLKRHIGEYCDAEAALWPVIAERFGLSAQLPDAVHEADNRILGDEIHQNMMRMDWHAKHDQPLGVVLEYWTPSRAEQEFVVAFRDIERLKALERANERRVA